MPRKPIDSLAPRFLIIEDHPEIAENNCVFLKKVFPDAICTIAETPALGLSHLQETVPQLMVIDLQFGIVSGAQSAKPALDLLQQVFIAYPTLNILVYTSEPSWLKILVKSLNEHSGDFVVVSKMERRQAFMDGAQSAFNGELRVPRELRQELKLNEKELQICELLCKSCTDEEIARKMNLSTRTIQGIIQRLKEKLEIDEVEQSGKSSRIALCMAVVQQKLIIL